MSKLKRFFKEKPLGKVLRSIGLGVVDSVAAPYGGVVKGIVTGVKDAVQNNVSDATTGEGQIDWIRLLTFIALGMAVVYLTWQLFTGNLTIDEFLKYLEELDLS